MGTESGEIVCDADFYVLPEGCIANILSFTSPLDACRLSLVSSIFRSAAESDDVWERFLPSDYQSIISRSDDSWPVDCVLMKKEFYFHLCDSPILIDGGKKSFSLEKLSGKKCFMIAPRDLTIIWGDTPSYWKWISIPHSRFAEVAELRGVCWLEIRGKIKTSMLSPETTYAAYLVCKFASAYGFDYNPVDVSVGIIGSNQSCSRTVTLDPDAGQRPRRLQIVRRRVGLFGRRRAHMLATSQPSMEGENDEGQCLKERGDGWFEVELGEYFNEKRGGGGIAEEDEELEMSLMEVKAGNWKGGLIIQGIEIRPKQGSPFPVLNAASPPKPALPPGLEDLGSK